MAFNPLNPVDRIRLLVGDFILDEPFLSNEVYLWLYSENGSDDLATAIAALQHIINYIALSPTEWKIGEAQETAASVTILERRLADLQRQQGKAAPILIHSDRKNWCDFDEAFGRTGPRRF
jgi:hypothetical protein